MSDTPRTTKLIDGIQARMTRRGFFVPEDFADFTDLARALERENSALNKEAQIVTDDLFNSTRQLTDARAMETELLAALRTARTYMNTQGEQSRLDVAQVDAALAKVRA